MGAAVAVRDPGGLAMAVDVGLIEQRMEVQGEVRPGGRRAPLRADSFNEAVDVEPAQLVGAVEAMGCIPPAHGAAGLLQLGYDPTPR